MSVSDNLLGSIYIKNNKLPIFKEILDISEVSINEKRKELSDNLPFLLSYSDIQNFNNSEVSYILNNIKPSSVLYTLITLDSEYNNLRSLSRKLFLNRDIDTSKLSEANLQIISSILELKKNGDLINIKELEDYLDSKYISKLEDLYLKSNKNLKPYIKNKIENFKLNINSRKIDNTKINLDNIIKSEKEFFYENRYNLNSDLDVLSYINTLKVIYYNITIVKNIDSKQERESLLIAY